MVEGVYTVRRPKSRWEQLKDEAKEIKHYLKGRFIERGHTYQPKTSWFGEEKYFGKEYRDKRRRKNKIAYQSRKHNSMRRRGKH